MAKLTVEELLKSKGKRKLACTTVHDYYTAKACEKAGIDMLVTSSAFLRQYIAGDMVSSGTMYDLLTVLEGVRKGAPDTFVYVALPKGIANKSDECAIEAAMIAMDHGADGIYYSGISYERIVALRKEMVPVFGHAGMIPWHKSWFNGCRAVGKTADEAMAVYHTSLKMQEAGCVAIELECVPEPVATAISGRLSIPTLSMGSGDGCDGQYLFSEDLLGQHCEHYPRHSLVYSHQFQETCEVLRRYSDAVKYGWSDTNQKLIDIPEQEMTRFKDLLDQE